MNLNLHAGDCIRTYSGLYMDVFNPTPEMIAIEDIAHALSNLCRFGGHTPYFYSVAQHSVICSKRVHPEFQLQALLHDASEAYLLDVPRPIKRKLTNYKQIEDSLMKVIAEKFGFQYPFDEVIKTVDNDVLEFEFVNMMEECKLSRDFCLQPEKAKADFLKRYNALCSPNPIWPIY